MIKIIQDCNDQLKINVDPAGLEALKALLTEVEQTDLSITSVTISRRHGTQPRLISISLTKGFPDAQNCTDDRNC